MSTAGSRRFKTARCVLRQEGRFLLVEHRTWHGRRRGRWGLPGGRIEWGEAPEVCVRRELREELSVDVGYLHEIGDYRYKGARHLIFGSEFADEIRGFDKDEIEQVRWFNLDEINSLESGGRLHAGFEARAVLALQTIFAD